MIYEKAVQGLVADKRFMAVAMLYTITPMCEGYEYPRIVDVTVTFRTRQTREDVYPYLAVLDDANAKAVSHE